MTNADDSPRLPRRAKPMANTMMSIRYGPKDKFWVVVDPGPNSTLGDVLFEASLADLELQFKGGLSMDSNPTIFVGKKAAEIDAKGRLVALRASLALSVLAGQGAGMDGAHTITVRDKAEKVLVETTLAKL